MRRTVIYGGIVLWLAIVLALGLRSPQENEADMRRSEVISAFINLSAAPDDRGLDFLSRERTQRENRAGRFNHIQASVLNAHAAQNNQTVESLVAQIKDPQRSNAFDYTGVQFDDPRRFFSGQMENWTWSFAKQAAETRASDGTISAACGSPDPCRMWLLYWTAEDWYYAPVGTATLYAAFLEAAPEFAEVLDRLEAMN